MPLLKTILSFFYYLNKFCKRCCNFSKIVYNNINNMNNGSVVSILFKKKVGVLSTYLFCYQNKLIVSLITFPISRIIFIFFNSLCNEKNLLCFITVIFFCFNIITSRSVTGFFGNKSIIHQ